MWQPMDSAPHDRKITVEVDGKETAAQWRVPNWDDAGAHGYWLGPDGPVVPTRWKSE